MTKPLALILLLSLLSYASSSSHHHHHATALGFLSGGGSPQCRGTVADCIGSAEEFDLGSEMSRRILATQRYISYNALRRDSVPCSRRGASYYNCRPGAQANPYSRGCSAITRCRS